MLLPIIITRAVQRRTSRVIISERSNGQDKSKSASRTKRSCYKTLLLKTLAIRKELLVYKINAPEVEDKEVTVTILTATDLINRNIHLFLTSL